MKIKLTREEIDEIYGGMVDGQEDIQKYISDKINEFKERNKNGT